MSGSRKVHSWRGREWFECSSAQTSQSTCRSRSSISNFCPCSDCHLYFFTPFWDCSSRSRLQHHPRLRVRFVAHPHLGVLHLHISGFHNLPQMQNCKKWVGNRLFSKISWMSTIQVLTKHTPGSMFLISNEDSVNSRNSIGVAYFIATITACGCVHHSYGSVSRSVSLLFLSLGHSFQIRIT